MLISEGWLDHEFCNKSYLLRIKKFLARLIRQISAVPLLKIGHNPLRTIRQAVFRMEKGRPTSL